MEIQKALFEMQDIKYRDFNAKLIPNIDKSTVIGVRVPQLRKVAEEIKGNADDFLENLPHKYYDENTLHAFLVSEIKDFQECIEKLNAFLPYVDNWATCDLMSPKCFKKNKGKLLLEIEKWLKADHEYTVRFGIEMLMTHFLDDDFDEKHLEKVSKIKSDKYYINMMIAWYFATALAKKWDSAVKYIENDSLSPWVRKKTVQKARESYRITDVQKEYLKNLIK
ncbi:MAG: DNA alkylation repair protein [Clostridia bacterium]|nr:DNA alkylation repair protein [Clostridia bacterium]